MSSASNLKGNLGIITSAFLIWGLPINKRVLILSHVCGENSFGQPTSLFFSSHPGLHPPPAFLRVMGPMGGFWTMKWEQRLPCATLPGLALLWDPPPLTIPLTGEGVQGIRKTILRPQETEGHKLEEFGPPVPVWKSSHWIPTLNFGRARKQKKQNKTTSSIVLYHPEFGVC